MNEKWQSWKARMKSAGWRYDAKRRGYVYTGGATMIVCKSSSAFSHYKNGSTPPPF